MGYIGDFREDKDGVVKKVAIVKVFASPEEKNRIHRKAQEDHRTDSNYLLNLFLEKENEKSK